MSKGDDEQERRISGWDLKKIREKCGYSAREFADFLRENRARITTPRSVYRLEEKRRVEFRYVEALMKLVGKDYYRQSLAELIREEEERERQREEMIRKRREEEEQHQRNRIERQTKRQARHPA